MSIGLPELPTLLIVLLGAFIGGFTTGFAGFGTGLVSSGLWFHVLPAPFVPPLVALASVAAQIVGLISLRKSFEWRRVYPYLAGAVIGVPLGVWFLKLVSPDNLKLFIGVFLVIYAVYLLFFAKNLKLRNRGGKTSDGMIGAGGGFLGGFAGLSGPLPLIWLQLQGGTKDQQRATYQPFNLVVLSFASLAMAVTGQMNLSVIVIALFCLPVTLLGAWMGSTIYLGVSEKVFKTVILVLLLASGLLLAGQQILRVWSG